MVMRSIALLLSLLCGVWAVLAFVSSQHLEAAAWLAAGGVWHIAHEVTGNVKISV